MSPRIGGGGLERMSGGKHWYPPGISNAVLLLGHSCVEEK